VEGSDGLYASAVYDKETKDYIIKVANTSDADKDINITFKGIKNLGSGKLTTLHSNDPRATNTLNNKENVMPQTTDIEAKGNTLSVKIPAKTFAVYRF
jgi:alpha-L-arabinofuranosidase